MSYHYESEVTVPRPRDEVFAFFAAAENLERLTPPWLSFQIVSETPVDMRPGALIDYRIKVRGLPMRWRTEITDWEPPHRFVDTQLRGPYRQWIHEHTFEEVELPGGRGTRCRDRVEYAVPGGPLAPLIHRFFVRRDIETIFDHRTQRLREIFGDGP